jgi:hypothetical protein
MLLFMYGSMKAHKHVCLHTGVDANARFFMAHSVAGQPLTPLMPSSHAPHFMHTSYLHFARICAYLITAGFEIFISVK